MNMKVEWMDPDKPNYDENRPDFQRFFDTG